MVTPRAGCRDCRAQFQQREGTGSGDTGEEVGGTPLVTSSYGHRPQHSASGPHREAVATLGPLLGSRSWELRS